MAEFDPDAYLQAPAEKPAFDPDAYLKAKAFDPDAYLAKDAVPTSSDPVLIERVMADRRRILGVPDTAPTLASEQRRKAAGLPTVKTNSLAAEERAKISNVSLPDTVLFGNTSPIDAALIPESSRDLTKAAAASVVNNGVGLGELSQTPVADTLTIDPTTQVQDNRPAPTADSAIQKFQPSPLVAAQKTDLAYAPPGETPAEDSYSEQLLNAFPRAIHSVTGLGLDILGQATKSVGEVVGQSTGVPEVEAPFRAASDWLEKTAESLKTLGDAGGTTDPIAITLNKVAPGSTFTKVYGGVSAGTAQAVAEFVAPENIPLFLTGGVAPRVLAGVFTALGLSQLPEMKKQFDGAVDLQDKVAIATQAVVAVAVPAMGLKGHPRVKIDPAMVDAEIHNNLTKVSTDMLEASLKNPNLAPELRTQISAALKAQTDLKTVVEHPFVTHANSVADAHVQSEIVRADQLVQGASPDTKATAEAAAELIKELARAQAGRITEAGLSTARAHLDMTSLGIDFYFYKGENGDVRYSLGIGDTVSAEQLKEARKQISKYNVDPAAKEAALADFDTRIAALEATDVKGQKTSGAPGAETERPSLNVVPIPGATEAEIPKPQTTGVEHIVSSAVQAGDRYLVGPKWNTPHDAINTWHEIDTPPAEETRGFVVQDAAGKQRFVTREEGQRIAIETGQTARPEAEGLHSQDLKPIDSVALGAPRATAPVTPAEPAVAVAEDYVRTQGATLGLRPSTPGPRATVDPEFARRLGEAYEALPDAADTPETKAAYLAFKREVDAQYDHAVQQGITFEFVKTDPYKSSAEMIKDVQENKRLKVYTGGADHPFLGESTRDANGLTSNDKFRAVHDLYGHASEANQFGPQGEERAWRKHAAMFSDTARPAMTAETRGQNSWVNYGPHMFDEQGNWKGSKTLPDGSPNPNYIPPQERPFAAQKASLLPDEFHQLDRPDTKTSLADSLKYLTPEEQAQVKPKAMQKLLSILEMLPSKEDFSEAALAGIAKRGRYRRSVESLVHIFGPDSDRMAALIAATSPQIGIRENMTNALRIWAAWTEAGRPTSPIEINNIMSRSVIKQASGVGVLPAWRNNTVRALTSADPANLKLSGSKVGSFAANLRGDMHEVTNDAHMANFAMVNQQIFAGRLSKQTGLGEKGPGYLAMSARIREAADYLTKTTGEKWTPAEVQETVWSFAKALYELRDREGETRTTSQILESGGLTHEIVGGVPDFNLLLRDEAFRPILEKAGYGPALAELNKQDAGRAGYTEPGVGGETKPVSGQAGAAAKRLENLRAFRTQRETIVAELLDAQDRAASRPSVRARAAVDAAKQKLKDFNAQLRGTASPDFVPRDIALGAPVETAAEARSNRREPAAPVAVERSSAADIEAIKAVAPKGLEIVEADAAKSGGDPDNVMWVETGDPGKVKVDPKRVAQELQFYMEQGRTAEEALDWMLNHEHAHVLDLATRSQDELIAAGKKLSTLPQGREVARRYLGKDASEAAIDTFLGIGLEGDKQNIAFIRLAAEHRADIWGRLKTGRSWEDLRTPSDPGLMNSIREFVQRMIVRLKAYIERRADPQLHAELRAMEAEATRLAKGEPTQGAPGEWFGAPKATNSESLGRAKGTPGSGGKFVKAFFDPNGKLIFPISGHDTWIYNNPNTAKEFGIDISSENKTDVRLQALNKGFARLNYELNGGRLTVEVHQNQWDRIKYRLVNYVADNAGYLDNLRVLILNSEGKVVRSDSVRLMDYADSEKAAQVPFVEEGGRTGMSDSMLARRGLSGLLGAPKETKGHNIDEAGKKMIGGMAGQLALDFESKPTSEHDLAVLGADQYLQGTTKFNDWKQAMVNLVGEDKFFPVRKTWDDMHALLSDYESAQVGKTGASVKRIIEESTGLRDAASITRNSIGDAITRADALAGYLRGMEKGSKLGEKDAAKQIQRADRWVSADQEKVRQTMTEFVNKTLPPAERGRFIGAIGRALRRPDILSGDPAVMYRNAFRVMRAIEARSEEVYRKDTIMDVRKTVNRMLESPTVDLKVKQMASRILQDINLKKPSAAAVKSLQSTREYLDRMEAKGENVTMPRAVLTALEHLGHTPLEDLPTRALDSLQIKINLLDKLGRSKFKSRIEAWEGERDARLAAMVAGESSPIEMNEIFRPQPGEKLTVKEKFQNFLSGLMNRAKIGDLGHMPEDVIFDMLQSGKGTYSGPLFDHVRTPMDAAYDAAQRRFRSADTPLHEIVRRNKLSDEDETLIGLFAHLQQDGGEQRALADGVKPETIEKLKKSGLTQGQREAYDYMRKTMDEHLPDIQDVMYHMFNVAVEPVPNYFPWMREYEVFKPGVEAPIVDARTGLPISQDMLDTYGRLAGNFVPRNTSKLAKGFTIERQPGAKTAIRYDAFDVFSRHMYNASRLIEIQPTAKMAGDMIRAEEFQKKYGEYGQQLMNEWLTAAVTDGRGGAVHRWNLLDYARRASSRSMVFFRLTSNIKHASAIPQGFVNAGSPAAWYEGFHHAFTSEGHEFLKNFPQVLERGAGEMSYAELQNELQTGALSKMDKVMSFGDRYGFVLGKEIDALNSRAVFIGRYLRNLREAGLPGILESTIEKGSPQEAAAYNAMSFMRRTVSSTLAKDVQPVLGRGKGFGGNISLARAMNAFRQYALERFSLMRYDLPEAFKSGNYTKGVAMITALTAAGLYETQIPGAIKAGWGAIFGTKDDKQPKETWGHLLMHDFFSMFPYINNVMAAGAWKETGIPILQTLVDAAHAGYRTVTAQGPEARKRAVIETAGAVAKVAGVPGSGVATQTATDVLVGKDKKKTGGGGFFQQRQKKGKH